VNDSSLRIAAVIAAVALLAAPYRAQLQAAAASAWRFVYAHGGHFARIAAAVLIVAAAWGKVPLPSLALPAAGQAVKVETPSDAMQATVKPVADAFASAPMSDRMLWAQLWTKAAAVAGGDAIVGEVVFTDTRSLRSFVVLALDIGWRRIGGNQPGKYAGLREATEAAFANVVGKDVVTVTPELRQQFAELCRAIAWAALPPRG
jgi:hypothetical protein